MTALRQNKAACAYPAMLLNGVCASSGGVVMALLQERYGLSYQWSGLLLAMLSVGNLAAGFAAGMLPAHWGQRHTVLMLAGGAALGYGAMILTGSPWALLAAFTLVGVAKGTTLNTSSALIAAHARERTKCMNLIHACFATGSLLCPLFIAALGMGGLPWWAPMAGLALCGAALWGVFALAGLPGRTGDGARVKNVIKEIAKNKALLGVMFFSLVGMIGASVVNGLNTYLFKDYFGNVKIMAVSGGLSVLYSLITFAITQPLADKLGKKEWCCWGAGFAAAVFALLFFFPIHNPVLFIVINGVCYLGASGMQVLIWAMVNDSIDYHELQTGERNEGIVYSTYSFFRKLASAVSGSLSSFVLGFIGYNVAEGAVQTAEVSNAIWKSYTGIYVLGYGVAVAILFFVYPLTKAKTTEMLEQLKARRAEKASAVETDGEQCP